MLKLAIALAALALLPATALAQSPTPTPTPTATEPASLTPGDAVPTGTATPPSAATPPTATPEATFTPTPAGGMIVSAQLPVPPGTQVQFDILTPAGQLLVCGTALTSDFGRAGLSLVVGSLPPLCGEGTRFHIGRCAGEPCVRVTAADELFAYFGFVPGTTLDLGALAAITPESVVAPETGSGSVQTDHDVRLWLLLTSTLAGVALLLIGALAWRRSLARYPTG